MDLKNKTKYSTLIEWSGFLSPRSNISKIEFFDFCSMGKSKIISFSFRPPLNAVYSD